MEPYTIVCNSNGTLYNDVLKDYASQVKKAVRDYINNYYNQDQSKNQNKKTKNTQPKQKNRKSKTKGGK